MSFAGGSFGRTGIDRPQQQLVLHNLANCTLRTAVQLWQDSWEAGGERQEGRTGQGCRGGGAESEDRVGRGGGRRGGGENRLGADFWLC